MKKSNSNSKNDNSFNIEIGKRLKMVKNEHDFSQENMADILGISPAYYGKVERGLHCLSVEKLYILNEKLGVDLNYIITGKKSSQSKYLENFLEDCPPEFKSEMTEILVKITKLAIKK